MAGMTMDNDFFRKVMGHFATGVTIVTAKGSRGVAGLTVNAFCSVSLEPPLVLICVDLKSATLQSIRESGAFVINILSDQQEELSRCFAAPTDERYTHFCHADYRTAVTGSPILENTLGFVDARVVAEYPGGDHMIFVGQVEMLGIGHFDSSAAQVHASINEQNGAGMMQTQHPLVYYCGKYRHLAPDYKQSSQPPARRAGIMEIGKESVCSIA